MIEYILSEKELLSEELALSKIFNLHVNLPNNLFKKEFKYFTFIEFDLIYGALFYKGMCSFLNSKHESNFTFFVHSPSPKDYFFKYFKKYNLAKIPVNASYDEFLDFLALDPGDSPADALIYNSDFITLSSDSSSWGVVGSRDREIGIVGFKNKNDLDLFLDSFEDDIFSSLEERINIIKKMLKLPIESVNFYDKLKLSYNPPPLAD